MRALLYADCTEESPLYRSVSIVLKPCNPTKKKMSPSHCCGRFSCRDLSDNKLFYGNISNFNFAGAKRLITL